MTRPIPPQHKVKNRASNWRNKRIDGTFKKSKRGKYNAKGRHIDGHWFASEAEAMRYEQLTELVKAGKIHDLELQPTYPCHIQGHLITTYRADFRYKKREPGRFALTLIEDVKGMITPEYTIKRKLVEALHQVKIIEIPSDHVRKGRTRLLTADELGVKA